MKTQILTFASAAALVSLLAAPAAEAQIATPQASPKSTVMQRVGLTDVTVTYSRPGMKNRAVFGALVPYGKRWRTGANGTTTLKLSDDATIEGKKIPAGEYGIYTIPNKTEWLVVINKGLKQGADVDGFKDDQDVARFSVKPYKLGGKVETFTLNFADLTPATANLEMQWEMTGLKLKIVTDVEPKVMAQITEKVINNPAATPGDMAAAAVYYAGNDKDPKQALAWMEKANAAEPTKYWNLHTEAKMRLKAKDFAGATKVAEASRKAALADKNADYVKMNEDLMAEAKKMGK